MGDYTSLRWLHTVIHDVNERSPLIQNKEGLFLNLAYDVRKAYEGQREILQPLPHYEEMGVRYGVQTLWPVLLLQQRMLRLSLAYIDHSAKTQAITYALEAIIEDALREDFAAQGADAIIRWKRLDPAHPEVFNKLGSRGAIFCSWTKAERKRHFLNLLSSFDPMYAYYYGYRIQNGEKNLLSPKELEQWEGSEWPDPKC
ncbi:MAG: hypothetical protein HC900_01550 [Methylacidiphilales bacterium]|nr:hypothetical protein [Candidatus Methylacidiphilales bacterium]